MRLPGLAPVTDEYGVGNFKQLHNKVGIIIRRVAFPFKSQPHFYVNMLIQQSVGNGHLDMDVENESKFVSVCLLSFLIN